MSRLIWPLGFVLLIVAITMRGTIAPGGDKPSHPEGDGDKEQDTTTAPARELWTTSRVVGSPEPPRPYVAEVAFPHLTFDRPVVLTFVPGTDRLAVAQVGGQVLTFDNDFGARSVEPMLDLRGVRPGFGSLYGLAFHPGYEENGRIFVCYTVGHNLDDGTRVSEFRTDQADPPRVDPATERILLTWYAGGHNGGCLQFGPEDGFLYISAGDGADPTPPDPFLAGQDMTTLLSKVMRIDVDVLDPGRPYRIPTDNPFVDLPGARPEIWALGFRNPWRMAFDHESGDLWLGDVGWELWELVHRVERGGNYGWSLMEGSQPVMPDGPRGPSPISPPVVEHAHSEAASITGGYVYRGNRLKDLEGAYLYGDFQTGTIWGLRLDGETVTWREVLAETPLRLVAFGEDRDGELYLLDYEQTNQVYRLVPNTDAGRSNRRFPRLLSETGLFASVADHEPAPGVLGFEINAPLWADGTGAERLMGVPGTGRIGWERDGLWAFPEGSVLVRTVTLDQGQGGQRRLETQLLHLERGSWRPYSYRWNDEQTDAELVGPEGESVTLTVADAASPGGSRTVSHRIAARSECVLCHNPWAGEGLLFGRQSATPLTANTMQMNVDHNDHGRHVDQLRSWERLGLFDDALPESPGALPRLSDPYDEAIELDARARSYLQVNCAHCHRFGAGGSAAMFLTVDRPIEQTGTLGVRPMQGTFEMDDARIIAAGDPFGSVLYFRMAKLGAGRMPRVGSKQVDVRGLDMMYRWIARLGDDGGSGSPDDPFAQLPDGVGRAIDRLSSGGRHAADDHESAFRDATATLRGALALLRRIDEGAMSDQVVAEVAAMSLVHPKAEIRDLFERFVPESERVERIGDQVDLDAILGLEGDADRGRELFFRESASQCSNCHRIGGEGREVGPELDGIGAKYLRRELLEQIVHPSKVVEPRFASYLLETTSGLIHSGILVERSDRAVVLRDAQGGTIRVDTLDVEQLAPQQQSMMPERLLGGLTAGQAADLLAYLASQKTASP